MGKQNVTLQDIADRCGISKVTVSRALRDDLDLVKPATKQLILETAREMGYDPSQQHAARRLAMQKTGRSVLNHVIALFFPPHFYTYNYFNAVMRGMMDVLLRLRYGVLVNYTSFPWLEDEIDADFTDTGLSLIFSRGDVDGAVVFPGGLADLRVYDQLRAERSFGERPIVSILTPQESCSVVVADDIGGGYAVATHLLGLGHQYLLHSAHPDSYPHRQRLKGYRQACLNKGLNPDEALVFDEWSVDDKDESASSLIKLIRRRPEITAIMAPNDAVAIDMAEVLTRHGIRVPQDVSLTGYDDIEELPGQYGNNMLTTVRVPLVQIGYEAASLLVRLLTGESSRDEEIVLPVTLVERGSTTFPAHRARS